MFGATTFAPGRTLRSSLHKLTLRNTKDDAQSCASEILSSAMDSPMTELVLDNVNDTTLCALETYPDLATLKISDSRLGTPWSMSLDLVKVLDDHRNTLQHVEITNCTGISTEWESILTSLTELPKLQTLSIVGCEAYVFMADDRTYVFDVSYDRDVGVRFDLDGIGDHEIASSFNALIVEATKRHLS